MLKRITYEFIKLEFGSEGYVYIDEAYRNSKSKLNCVCPKGHKHSTRWDSWKQGVRCPYCYGNNKPSLEQVKKSFEKEGYILLSEVYVNNNTKLNYICSNNHTHNIAWNNWQRGQRCPYCTGRARLTVEQIRNAFEKENYVLLSKEYNNAFTMLNYKCSVGHVHSIRWNDWQQGGRCPTCAHIKFSLNQMGSKNHQWKGGLSFEPYCEAWKDKEYKNDIKLRDGNKCLNPYCESKNIDNLVIHHIDYNKKNCSLNNLITVCKSCNSKANKDREWHTSWYKAILNRRYGYE